MVVSGLRSPKPVSHSIVKRWADSFPARKWLGIVLLGQSCRHWRGIRPAGCPAAFMSPGVGLRPAPPPLLLQGLPHESTAANWCAQRRCRAACWTRHLADKPSRPWRSGLRFMAVARSRRPVPSPMSTIEEQTAHLQAGLCRQSSYRGPRYEPLSRAPFAPRVRAREVKRAGLLPV